MSLCTFGVRISLLAPGEIIVPRIRVTVMQPDEVFIQKDVNSTYVRHVGILLQNKVRGGFSLYAV